MSLRYMRKRNGFHIYLHFLLINPLSFIISGLCGTFNGDVANDLMMPNGTVYKGDGSEVRGQPIPFIEAWR